MKCHKPSVWLLLYVLVFGLTPVSRADENSNQSSPLIVVKTTKSMEQTLADLKQAISNNNYVFIRQQSIDSRLTDVTEENHQVIFVYFCNFNMLDRALKTDRRVGVFLPCKITLIQKPGYIKMVAINPKFISKQFDNGQLNHICNQLSRNYRQILDEAIL